jgi:hypothetical protein
MLFMITDEETTGLFGLCRLGADWCIGCWQSGWVGGWTDEYP